MRLPASLLLGLACIPAGAQAIAITGATAYLHPGQPPTIDATILVQDGRITASGAALPVPAGARIVQAHGRIVTPGLMNSDSQLGLVETGTEDTSDPAVSSGLLGAAFDISPALNPNSVLLQVARADGLTRAVVLPTGSATAPFDGLGAILTLDEGSAILNRSRAVEVAELGGMVVPRVGGSRAAQWQLLRAALNAARSATGGHPVEVAALGPLGTAINLEALVPVLERTTPLAIVAARESDLRQAVALAQNFHLRLVLIGAEEAWRIAPLLAANAIPVVLDPFASGPATYDQMGARLDNAAILDRAGVAISFKAAFVHVSHNAGMAIREGAGIAVANGLPYDRALRALTLTPAETWGIADHYGTLDPGRDADLVLWDGDPLEPSSAPVLVLVRGREVSLRTRQTELEQRYQPTR